MRQEEENKRMNEIGQINRPNNSLQPFNKAKEFSFMITNAVLDLRILYYSLLLIVTFLGVVIHPFFYTFLLSFFVSRRKTLMNVLRAIVKPGKTLSLTILLMFMVIYVFTVFSYSYYSSYYTENDCYSLWTCFIIGFDSTFKNDGGIGGYLDSAYTQDTDKVEVNYGRVFFDNIFFLLVGILLIEIVSGSIIDTFADLRQLNNEIEDDCKKV